VNVNERVRLYRGWDVTNLKMLYDEFGIYDREPIELIFEDDGEFINHDYRYLDNIIIMDYINQNDINDAKIYVGDILFHKNNLGVFIGVVTWINTEYISGYGIKWIIGNCTLPWYNFEIIGNVFEHPELINNQ